MHRQSSKTTTQMDTLDCIANTNDLVLENEMSRREHDQRSKSRREESYRRSNETSAHRSTRHSPPAVTYKRPPSPPSNSSSSSRSYHTNPHYSSQKPHRTSSPSSPSPPSSSSRYHRSTRPTVPTKRPHPRSESPYERRPATYRSRQELPTEQTIGDFLTFVPSTEENKFTAKQELGDTNRGTQDESNRIHHSRSNSSKTNEPSLVTNDSKFHSTPSASVVQSTLNESLLEMSNISQECELSLFPKSMLSTTNTSSIATPTINPTHDMMHTMDLISKYNTMQATLSNNPHMKALSEEILAMIQKHIALQKLELDNREKEVKIRQSELAEREKRFNTKSSEPIISITPVTSESSLITKPNTIEETTPVKSESSDLVNISPDESAVSSIPPTVDTSKVTLTNRIPSTQTSVSRKTRFSQLTVDPSIFSSSQKPVLELYSDELDAPSDSISPPMNADLKITSSSTCRKVEIQTEKGGSTNKELPNDLRLTLVKNRAKQSNNDEQHHNTNGSDDQQSTMNVNEDKPPSFDYQQQRSFTPIEPIIDSNQEKRDVRRHRQQYSSSNNNSNERSYKQNSSSRYQSNQKRYDNDDRSTRGYDFSRSKASRTTHKNNY